MAHHNGLIQAERDRFYETLRKLGVEERLGEMLRERYLATLEEVIGPGNEQHITRARAELMAYFMDRNWSHVSIARLFGRTPAAVNTAVENHRKRRLAALDGTPEGK